MALSPWPDRRHPDPFRPDAAMADATSHQKVVKECLGTRAIAIHQCVVIWRDRSRTRQHHRHSEQTRSQRPRQPALRH